MKKPAKYEGSKADMAKDKGMAKKMKMPAAKFEGSKADMKMDKAEAKKRGMKA